jgi:hypothetical protein
MGGKPLLLLLSKLLGQMQRSVICLMSYSNKHLKTGDLSDDKYLN